MDQYQIVNGTFYDRRTPRTIVDVLEFVRHRRHLIRLYYGDPETGQDWNEERDVVGHIGRSLGPVKVPLLVARGEDGGPQLLDHCIVKLRLQRGRILWQHPKYHSLNFIIRPSTLHDYTADVLRGEEVHARFKTWKQADRYVKFVTG
jgi:hypothetical protein